MSETKHTPGPWEIDHNGYLQAAVSGVIICRIVNSGGIVFHADFSPAQPANARLIAAAPELLEALKSARTLLQECADDTVGTPSMVEFAEAVKLYDAAIARAEGRDA